jgi:hypothetical protein
MPVPQGVSEFFVFLRKTGRMPVPQVLSQNYDRISILHIGEAIL